MTIVKSGDETKKVTVEKMEGAEKVQKELLIGPKENPPNFAMRRFTVGNGGQTPLHTHDWEHEVYILKGKGEVMTEDGPQNIEAGNTVYVNPGEKHQFKSDSEELVFLCLVPNRGEPSFEE